MSVLDLESLARRHWQEYLPDKAKELRAEGKFTEAVHGAAVLAQQEIEHLMQHRGYSISEAREVALPLFILLPEEPQEDEQAAELAELDRAYHKSPPPESQM